MKRTPLILLALSSLALGLPLASQASAQAPEAPAPVATGRQTEPVVMTGERFPEWATLADVALEGPTANGGQCELEGHEDPGEGVCTHNQYEDPDFQTSDFLEEEGVPVDRLLGYRWNADSGQFEQIPFQVDEMFVRYLSNNNSGFAFYSETDQHTSYAFDREGFRWTGDRGNDPAYAGDPMAPCLARPTSEVAPDPVKGLDTDDELVFMYDDAGTRAVAEAALPPGVEDSYEVVVADPTNPGEVAFAYVMLAGPEGPEPAFDETNGYVRYERDAADDENVFLYSQSSYGGYGAAPKGAWFDPATGTCVTNDPRQRRPGDKATISTPRYRFRYDGRWLMTQLRVSERATNGERFADLGASLPADWYDPDIIDQWKARAFQQRPSGQTPCCGYEEEVNNWGGSTILMGELSGPVRAIRETWGADSGTNVVRREIFYRDEIRFGSFLRVHVIPPLDGIYAEWDYNAGLVDTYYNPFNPDGVAIDGQNDEVFGNSRIHAGPDAVTYDGDDEFSDTLDEVTGEDEQKVGDPNEPSCEPIGPQSAVWEQFPEELTNEIEDNCIYNDIDSPDPTFSGVVAGLNWEQVSGDNGTVVLRTAIKHFTPGGTAQGLIAVPYYRDDSCFDDGTGSNPGPHLNGRSADTGPTATYNGEPRRCWTPEDGTPAPEGDARFWQGSMATHGVHILVIADSDNAHAPVPITEIDSEQRMVVLPGKQENVGDAYGRANEKPLAFTAVPESRATSEKRASGLALSISSPGNQTTATATLTDADSGTALEGRTIRFLVNGIEVATAVTDASGRASRTFKSKKGATVGAVFDGDDWYLGSST